MSSPYIDEYIDQFLWAERFGQTAQQEQFRNINNNNNKDFIGTKGEAKSSIKLFNLTSKNN